MVLHNYFTKISQLILSTSFLLWANATFGMVLFEGYYKIQSEGKHIGYSIQRYDVDPKANTITSTMFLQTNALGNDVTESLKATADNGFKPISYQYTMRKQNSLRVIDAKFKDGKMEFAISNGAQKETGTAATKGEVFLSTFLGFLILREGYSAGKNFSYEALPEEDGIAVEEAAGKKTYKPAVQKGTALVRGPIKYSGLDVFEVENTFMGATFNSYVWNESAGTSRRFDWLKMKSPALGIESELVTDPKVATAGFKVPVKTLKVLFGDIPTGQKNVLVEKNLNPTDAAKSSGGGAGGK